MPKALQAAITLGCTSLLLLAMLLAHPFLRASDALDALFQVPPKWTQVEDLYTNADTQEVTHGDTPVPSLKILQHFWATHPQGTRLLFVGNSQMHTLSLARGEARPTGREKTYVDQIADRLSADRGESPNPVMTYRLSSSGMSYPEVLWDLMYMMDQPDLRPDAIVLQMNYQAFWTGGIRDGILSLLDDDTFHAQVKAAAAADQPYSAAFAEALRRYDERRDTHNPTSAAGNSVSSTFSAAATPGYAVETVVRRGLDQIGAFRDRAEAKEDVVQFLYRCRLYFLRLKPSTARSVTGGRLLAARAAVVDIVKLCHEDNVQLFLFSAPVNPRVSLYRTPEDHASYRSFVEGIAAQNGAPLYDFEDAVPAKDWGNLLNGPDPLHMGRSAHARMAGEMYERIPLNRVTGHH